MSKYREGDSVLLIDEAKLSLIPELDRVTRKLQRSILDQNISRKFPNKIFGPLIQ